MGIVLELVIDICGSGVVGFWVLINLVLKMLEVDFVLGFMVKYFFKDLCFVWEVVENGLLLGVMLVESLFILV